jgi:hypothetical protein
MKTMGHLGPHVEEDILRPCRHFLTSSYFNFDGQFYKKTDGMAMGSPESHVIANFFMEESDWVGLDWAICKPLCWFHYLDDIWLDGPDRLRDFLDCLNTEHHLPLLDINIYRRPDRSRGRKIFSEPSHTDLCLNSGFRHYPANSYDVLVYRSTEP